MKTLKNKTICPYCKKKVKKNINNLEIKKKEGTLDEWLEFYEDKKEYGFSDNGIMVHSYCNIKNLIKMK